MSGVSKQANGVANDPVLYASISQSLCISDVCPTFTYLRLIHVFMPENENEKEKAAFEPASERANI